MRVLEKIKGVNVIGLELGIKSIDGSSIFRFYTLIIMNKPLINKISI